MQGNNRGEEIVRQPEGDVSDSVSGEARQMMGGATRRWGLRAAAARSAAAPRTFRNLCVPTSPLGNKRAVSFRGLYHIPGTYPWRQHHHDHAYHLRPAPPKHADLSLSATVHQLPSLCECYKSHSRASKSWKGHHIKTAFKQNKRLRWRRFAPVAKQWLAGLLEELDVPRQGVDLLGRDSLLLGAP